jgi:monoamine oxidase
MLKKLNNQPITKQRVTQIVEGDGKLIVTCTNKQTYQYDQVINTAPLGCIGTMDLEGCSLLYNQKTAIRCLQYSASTKVGLKFERRWWEDEEFMKKNQRVGGHSITGGQSATDLPIRCCVYPSYGRDLQQLAPGILLACYNWGQDASRIGALVGTNDEELLEVVLNDVSKLHNIPREKIPPVLNHFAHSWSSDQYTRGAFAMFGPGQFGNASSKAPIAQASSFVSLKAPAAKGKLHFAGEATSVHHAWVQGALNSAWRAVYNALEGYPEKQDELINRWGIPDEESPTHLKILSLLAQNGKL